MIHISETEILFDDATIIATMFGGSHLNNLAANINSDCTNNIYNPQEDESVNTSKVA